MSRTKHKSTSKKFEQDVIDAVTRKSLRKESSKQQGTRNPWFGLGFFGLIGWSIAIPTLVGIWIGLTLDKRYSGPASWTLTLMFCGLVFGCINAAYWVRTENARRSNNSPKKESDDN